MAVESTYLLFHLKEDDNGGLYSFIILVICVGQWVLRKIIDVGEEEMRDTPVHKWYLLGSWALLIPILILIWTMDRSRPNPIWPFLLSVIFCFRGYMGGNTCVKAGTIKFQSYWLQFRFSSQD